ncbi:MAG: CPXCG motif-containing cysteine-rich protein [Planctomycetes bacterium]|nr:CPXCG motif-containing cysteine-rich protein [Planctomycetota bacterium]
MIGMPANEGDDAAIAKQILEALSAPSDAPHSPRKPKRRTERDEGVYTCPSCGESIVVPLDPTAGDEQRYVEDCPVCCNPIVIHVEFVGDDEPARVWAEAE